MGTFFLRFPICPFLYPLSTHYLLPFSLSPIFYYHLSTLMPSSFPASVQYLLCLHLISSHLISSHHSSSLSNSSPSNFDPSPPSSPSPPLSYLTCSPAEFSPAIITVLPRQHHDVLHLTDGWT